MEGSVMRTKKVFRFLLISVMTISCLLTLSCPEAPGTDGELNGDETPQEFNDFLLISGSGTLTLSITGLVNGEYDFANSESMLHYGAAGIPVGEYERVGNAGYVTGNTMVLEITNGGEDFLFPGGIDVAMIGCMLDVNSDGDIDTGEWVSKNFGRTINGNETISLNFPEDFIEVETSSITLNVSGLTSNSPDFSNMGLHYGAAGITYGMEERIGASTEIGADTVSRTLQYWDGEVSYDYSFIVGTKIAAVGCLIDTNEDGVQGDGDYFAGVFNLTVEAGHTINLTYPDDFELISGSGTITLNISGLTPQIGHAINYGASGITFGGAERVGDGMEITQDTMSLPVTYEEAPFVFTGGSVIPYIGYMIDSNDNGIVDDGDYLGAKRNYTVNGNAVIELTYNP